MRTGVRRETVALLTCAPLLVLPAASPHGPVAASATPRVTVAAVPPAPAPERSPRSVTVALTGDVLIHDTVWQSARREAARRGDRAGFDFRPMLAPIRSIISGADLAICHLEVPLARADGPYSNYPLFAAPQEIVPALRWTGYDACSTGSNHSIDQGNAGLVRTLRALDRNGLRHTGTSRSPGEKRRVVLFDVGGIRVAWLEYSWGTNGIPIDPGKRWSVNLIDPERILRDAHRARVLGADAVLVGLHWGEEYQPTPSAFQVDLARRLTSGRDITLVYGHHAHVVQPVRKVNRTWVVFGLGNLLADQATVAPGIDRGLIALVTLTQDVGRPARVSRVTTVPTRISSSGDIRVRPVRPGT